MHWSVKMVPENRTLTHVVSGTIPYGEYTGDIV